MSKQCQALVDLKVLAASDSVDAFVLSYSSLLEGAPGITPALLERLVTARPNRARTDVKLVYTLHPIPHTLYPKADVTQVYILHYILYPIADVNKCPKPEPFDWARHFSGVGPLGG